MASRRDVRSGNRVVIGQVVLVALWAGPAASRAERPELVLMTGHSQSVNSLDFSRDGQRLLSASDDQTAVLWDVSSGQRLQTFSGHTGRVFRALFTPDERRVVTVSYQEAILWDVETGRKMRTLKDPQGRPIYSVAVTLDGNRLITSGDNLLVWSVGTGELLHATNDVHSGLSQIAVSPDGVHFAIAGDPRSTIDVWDIRSMRRVRSLKGHDGPVESLAFNHDGTRLLSGSEDRTAVLWDPASGEMLHRTAVHTHQVTYVAFNGDGTRYGTAQGRMQQTCFLWDTASGERLLTIPSESVAEFSPDGKLLATGAFQHVSIRDAASGRKIRDLGASRAALSGLDVSPNGQKALVVANSRASIWDMSTGRPGSSVFEHTGLAVYARGSTRIALAAYDRESNDCSVVVRDAATRKPLNEIPLGRTFVKQMAFAPDGQTLAVVPVLGPPFLLDTKSGAVERRLDGHRTFVRQVAFSPDDRRVVTLGDGDLAVTDIHDGEVTLRIAAQPFDCFALNSPGTVIAAGGRRFEQGGGRQGCVTLWEAHTGRELQTLKGHRARVTSLAFFPNDGRLLSGSEDGTLKVWDTSAGKEILACGRPGQSVHVVAVRPDGEAFVAGRDDGQLTAFDARTGRILQRTELDASFGTGILQFDADGGRLLADRFLLEARTLQEIRRFGDHGYSVAFSHDGRRVLTEGSRFQEGAVVADLWDADTGRRLRSFVRPRASDQHSYPCAAFSRDATRIVTGGQWNAVLWDTATGEKKRTLRSHSGRVSALRFSADGSRIVTAGGLDESVIVWDRNAEKPLRVIETECVTYFADISPDGTTVLAPVEPDEPLIRRTGMYGAVALVDAATGERKRHFAVHKESEVLLGKFDPSGKYVLTAAGRGSLVASDAATGRRVQEFQGHEAPITDFQVGPAGRRLFSASWDGTLRVWDFDSGRDLARILHIDEGREWLAVTPEGYFDGSLRGREVVAWKVGNERFPLEQYEQRFHRPDLVARSLRGQSLDAEPAVSSQRRPPSVSLAVEETHDEFAVVRAEATPGSRGSSIRSVRITVNGRDLPVERLRAVVRERRSDDTVVFRAHVSFPPGRDRALVSAVAIDDFDLESVPARATIVRTAPAEDVRGTLYVLAVGVSRYQFEEYDLNYAHADAEALAGTLRRQQGRAFAAVESRVLTDEKATVDNVKAALEWLKKSCTPADVAILLFSGHGVRGRRGLYYVTHEADLDALRYTCLNWQEVSSALDDVRAQAVLFLADCCHAGAFGDRAATQDELAESLLKQAGVMVFASSRGHEQSLERADWGHGAFTQALLTGLAGEADLPIGSEGADGRVTVSELQTYVSARVAQMTDSRQHPYIPRLARFDPLLVVALP